MKVRELIDLLSRFSPESDVHLGVHWPDRVTETHEAVWVGDYGDGPQINAAMDLRGVRVYVGCVLQQHVKDAPTRTIKLGHYDRAEDAAKVRDFYIIAKGFDEPLNFPDFDYKNWIPPRMSSGDYNEHIAAILKEQLMRE